MTKLNSFVISNDLLRVLTEDDDISAGDSVDGLDAAADPINPSHYKLAPWRR